MSKRKEKEAPRMDILELYKHIQQFNEREKSCIVEYQNTINRIDVLCQNKEKFHLRQRMVYHLQMTKSRLVNLIEEFENLQYFFCDVQSILQKYHDLNNRHLINPFFNSDKKTHRAHTAAKKETETAFLLKLKEYTNLKKFELMLSNSKSAALPRSSPPPCVCGNKTEFIRDEDRAVCALCSTEQSLICNTSSFSDVGRVNMACKYTYNRKVHFRDCIIQYQGKQKTYIPPEIYTLLEKELVAKQLIEKDDISPPSALPLSPGRGLVVDQKSGSKTPGGVLSPSPSEREARYKRVTRVDVLQILKEYELKKFYDDIVLVHCTLTAQPCDNIEYLEEALLNDFDKLTDTYDNMYSEELQTTEQDQEEKCFRRKNFINAQFVLYQLLKKHGHACSEMDFITLKTSERKRFHHTICKELFAKLGWKYSHSI